LGNWLLDKESYFGLTVRAEVILMSSSVVLTSVVVSCVVVWSSDNQAPRALQPQRLKSRIIGELN
jgi:hypothetical protein